MDDVQLTRLLPEGYTHTRIDNYNIIISLSKWDILQVVISNDGWPLAPSYPWRPSERSMLHQCFGFKQTVLSQLQTYYAQVSAIMSVNGVENMEKQYCSSKQSCPKWSTFLIFSWSACEFLRLFQYTPTLFSSANPAFQQYTLVIEDFPLKLPSFPSDFPIFSGTSQRLPGCSPHLNQPVAFLQVLAIGLGEEIDVMGGS